MPKKVKLFPLTVSALLAGVLSTHTLVFPSPSFAEGLHPDPQIVQALEQAEDSQTSEAVKPDVDRGGGDAAYDEEKDTGEDIGTGEDTDTGENRDSEEDAPPSELDPAPENDSLYEENSARALSAKYDHTKFLTLFDKKKIIKNFRSMDKIFPSYKILNDKRNVFRFDQKPRRLPNFTYQYNKQTHRFEDLLKRTGTTGLLVIKDDKMVTERYYHGNDAKALNTSWSMSKSITSALVGIAIDEGYIESVDDPITDYLPELKDSGYDGVSIKDILNMASGVKYPVYEEPFLTEWYQTLFVKKKSFNEMMTTLTTAAPPGTFTYKGSDTQVLGMLLKKTTGKQPSKYLEEKIWKPLGMESPANWNTDLHGDDMTFAYLNATLRDYAKIGRLYLNNGNWNGKQIISEDWVKETYIGSEGFPFYKYQWWIPPSNNPNSKEILASGIYGQSIYVNQDENVIIVKTSVNSTDEDLGEEITVFREIVEILK
ncbi:beta-lactamase family protein [Brevibacillus ruminantium]|uniref:Beta-lactamase family protein n=1 Tax=Brevibacillus ruminantium TaxID=2950604 RepID=A0ABY4WHE2_9BACL|nr:serine hydrolase [Brevibacillus ruminantium]USG66575.1 beta-lactamase family protein [Brevibacillus ruminantium]